MRLGVVVIFGDLQVGVLRANGLFNLPVVGRGIPFVFGKFGFYRPRKGLQPHNPLKP